MSNRETLEFQQAIGSDIIVPLISPRRMPAERGRREPDHHGPDPGGPAALPDANLAGPVQGLFPTSARRPVAPSRISVSRSARRCCCAADGELPLPGPAEVVLAAKRGLSRRPPSTSSVPATCRCSPSLSRWGATSSTRPHTPSSPGKGANHPHGSKIDELASFPVPAGSAGL